jgi:Topoisomerase IA
MTGKSTASRQRVSDIAAALKTADKLILATDPDREGEAISWHVLEVLGAKRGALKGKTIQRVVFNAITKQAVLDAMAKPRDVDQPLVEAYLARRALDYLVGFTLSPFSGASCPVPVRPAACSRWRCASSATARTRSRSSSLRNTGRSSPASPIRPATSSTPACPSGRARRSAASTSPMA